MTDPRGLAGSGPVPGRHGGRFLRLFRLLYLVAGVALLIAVLARTDLAEVGARLAEVGVWGAVAIVALHGLAFLCDTASWQLMLLDVPIRASWLYRLWKVRMVGEAFNTVMPAASFGGEPAKAILLKKRHRIGYGDSIVSLVIARTTNLIALIGFSLVGFFLMLGAEGLSPAYRTIAAFGMLGLVIGAGGFFAIQRWRLSSRVGGWLSRRPWGQRWGRRLEGVLATLERADAGFVEFYHRRPRRFAGAIALAFANWTLGAIEIAAALYFLGAPVSFAEAWVIETVVQLVRVGTFFVPANLGTIEAASVIMVQALTGQPALGLAAALVRRARELLFVAWGLGLSWLAAFSPAVVAAEVTRVGRD